MIGPFFSIGPFGILESKLIKVSPKNYGWTYPSRIESGIEVFPIKIIKAKEIAPALILSLKEGALRPNV